MSLSIIIFMLEQNVYMWYIPCVFFFLFIIILQIIYCTLLPNTVYVFKMCEISCIFALCAIVLMWTLTDSLYQELYSPYRKKHNSICTCKFYIVFLEIPFVQI